MRIGFITDLHVGNHRAHGGPVSVGVNARCAETLAAVRYACQVANAMTCAALVVCGDLFDTPRPLPQQLSALRDELYMGPEHILLLVGNHDRVSWQAGDHALGPLQDSERVDVFDQPRLARGFSQGLLVCPFEERPVLDWLPEFLEQVGDVKPRVVAAHFGLYERAQVERQPWLATSHDAVAVEDLAPILQAAGVRELVVGNYHSAQTWTFEGLRMHQVGSLVPTGLDNPGLDGYGGLLIYDTETGEVSRVQVPGPRFVVARSVEEIDLWVGQAECRDDVTRLYVDCRVPHAELAATEAHIEALRAKGYTEHVFQVGVEATEHASLALQVAAAVRNVSTLAEAAEQYVAKVPLPDGVRRERVLALVKGALRL